MRVQIKRGVRSGTWCLPDWEFYTDEQDYGVRNFIKSRAELHDIVFGAMKQTPTETQKIAEVRVNGLTYKLDYELLGVRTVTVLTDWVKNWYTQK